MLTTLQKATILRKAGIEIPASPVRKPPIHDRHGAGPAHPARSQHDVGAEEEHPSEAAPENPMPVAMHRWAREIDNLFVTYAAARAAKSLRDAEAARQMVMLRKLSSNDYA